MNNLRPATVNPDEIPEGFTAASSAGGGAGISEDDQKKQAQEEQKQAILEQALSPEALARLRRIKLVKNKKAAQVENSIVNMAMSGKLPGQISEGKLIEMLERGSAQEAKANATKSITIQRKKYAFDSDEDDDNDDDL